MEIFDLEIYDEKIGEFIKNHKDGFDVLFDPMPENVPHTDSVDDYKKLMAGGLITFLVEKNYINDNWIVAYDFYEKASDSSLFRGINPAVYSVFLKDGTDRNTLEGHDLEFEKLEIPKTDLLWASGYLLKAWEYARKFNPSIIAIYDRKFFKQIYTGLIHAWVRKNNKIGFKDTVRGVFVISYKY